MPQDYCHANPPSGINYGKPHVPVNGLSDGQPIVTCLYCGKTLQLITRSSQAAGFGGLIPKTNPPLV